MSLTLPESIRSNFDDAATRIETSIGVAKEYVQKQIDQLVIDDQLVNQLKKIIDSVGPVISGESIGQEVLSEEIALSLAVNYSYEEGIYFYLKLPDIPADVLSSLKTGFLLVGGVFGTLLDLQLLVKDDDKTLLDIGLTLSAIKTDPDTGEVTFKLTQCTPEEYEVKKVAKSFREYIINNIAKYDDALAEGVEAITQVATEAIAKIEASKEAAEKLKAMPSIYGEIIDRSRPPVITQDEWTIYSDDNVKLECTSSDSGSRLTIEMDDLSEDHYKKISAFYVLVGWDAQRKNIKPLPIKIQDADGETLVDTELKFDRIGNITRDGKIYFGEAVAVYEFE